MDNRDYEVLQRIESNLAEINRNMSQLPCSVNGYKISILQRIVYGGVSLILVAVLTSILTNNVKSPNMPVAATRTCNEGQSTGNATMVREICQGLDERGIR